jgi:LysM repeat protein
MRMRIVLPLLVVASLAVPSFATAYFPHTITAGESLNSIAAADGLSVAELAAANGLSTSSGLILGQTLQIPPQGVAVGISAVGSSAVPVSTATSSAGSYVVQPGDTLSAIAERAGTSVAQLAAANGLDPNGILLAGSALQVSGSGASSSAGAVSTTSAGAGSYLVQPGDTLTAIAERAGTSVAQLAVSNGLDPNGILLAGSVLHLSGSGTAVPVSMTSTPSAEGQPVGAVAEGNPTDPPYPTPERVSAGEVGSIASANGVSPSLAEAIGWQESGFNNDLVSSADARGVMQILPGTWDWINRTLTAGVPLAPASAASNVRGGVLLLHSLLGSTGGDPAMAAASYYQGLSSVQRYGMFSDTQQYVNSVMALRQQFGGG